MKLRIDFRYVFAALGTATLILGFACTPMATMDSSSSSGFNLVAATSVVGPGESLQLSTSGGSPPFTYSVYGIGTVTSAGTSAVYTAPSSIPSGTTSSSVMVNDSTGASRVFSISFQNGGLSYVLSPSTPTTSTAIVITPVGGTAPYTYNFVSGSGSLNGNVYTTSAYVESATVTIMDSTAQVVTVTINTAGVSSSSLGFIANVSMSQWGAHIAGGPGCTASQATLGKVADATYNNIYGDQVLCGTQSGTNSSSQVLTNFTISSSSSCPGGYSNVGSVGNCQAGYSCNSPQAVCAAYGTYGSSSRKVTDIYITAEATAGATRSVSAPACASGYTQMGQVANCGNGTCYGLQSVCVSYQ